VNFDVGTYKKATTSVRKLMLLLQAALGGSVLEFSYKNDETLGHLLTVRMSWTPSMSVDVPNFDPTNLSDAIEKIGIAKRMIETGLGAEMLHFGYKRDADHGHVLITKFRWHHTA